MLLLVSFFLFAHFLQPKSTGFIWGINSFDQFGVELGKHLAKHVRAQLSASRKTGASVQGFNSSTSSLLDIYLKQQPKAAN